MSWRRKLPRRSASFAWVWEPCYPGPRALIKKFSSLKKLLSSWMLAEWDQSSGNDAYDPGPRSKQNFERLHKDCVLQPWIPDPKSPHELRSSRLTSGMTRKFYSGHRCTFTGMTKKKMGVTLNELIPPPKHTEPDPIPGSGQYSSECVVLVRFLSGGL